MTNNVKQRRIILDLAVTLDGFIEGKNGEVDWCIMDPDMGFASFLNQLIRFYMVEKAMIYGEIIFRKLTTLIPKKKFGNWFIVRKNTCFPERI